MSYKERLPFHMNTDSLDLSPICPPHSFAFIMSDPYSPSPACTRVRQMVPPAAVMMPTL